MAFQNTTVFLAPVCFSKLPTLQKQLKSDSRWCPVDREELSTDYLLHYVHQVTQDPTRFQAYRLCDLSVLNLYMYQDKAALSGQPVVDDVRMFAFGTGIGFLAFYVTYGDMTPEQIKAVEDLVNEVIKADIPVVMKEITLDEAKAEGFTEISHLHAGLQWYNLVPCYLRESLAVLKMWVFD